MQSVLSPNPKLHQKLQIRVNQLSVNDGNCIRGNPLHFKVFKHLTQKGTLPLPFINYELVQKQIIHSEIDERDSINSSILFETEFLCINEPTQYFGK